MGQGKEGDEGRVGQKWIRKGSHQIFVQVYALLYTRVC